MIKLGLRVFDNLYVLIIVCLTGYGNYMANFEYEQKIQDRQLRRDPEPEDLYG